MLIYINGSINSGKSTAGRLPAEKHPDTTTDLPPNPLHVK